MYRIIEVKNAEGIKKFVSFPRKIYTRHDSWVPPLENEERKRFNPLENHFYGYGKAKLFAVTDEEGSWQGRVACIINPKHNEKFKNDEGFFGFFETIDDIHVVRLLFKAVAEELEHNHISRLIGPVNFTTNEECGLLIHGFDIQPTFMTNYSKPYYQTLLTQIGFKKETDLYAYEWNTNHIFPERLNRIAGVLKAKNTIVLRTFDKKKIQGELEKLWPVYNESFKNVWGFIPMTKEEFYELGYSFKLFADFNLILIAEQNQKTIGFCLTLPDINELIKKINGRLYPFGIFLLLAQKNRIKNLRLNVLAVLPEYRHMGVAVLLIHEIIKRGLQYGYLKGELSVVLESNNEIIRLIHTLNFTPTREFRIFSMAISELLKS